LVDHLEIANIDTILNFNLSGEAIASLAEFKLAINAYLKDLVVSPVRSLADVIAFNLKFSGLVSKLRTISSLATLLISSTHFNKIPPN
jgi:amidase